MAFKARVLVTGAGGFIGHHLVSALVGRGYLAADVAKIWGENLLRVLDAAT